MAEKSETTAPEAPDAGQAAPAKRRRRPVWNVRDELEDLLEGLQSGSLFGAGWQRRGVDIPFRGLASVRPTLDIIDKGTEIKLVAELPGMAEEDIDLRVTDHSLTLRGEKTEEVEEGDEDGDYYVNERRFGAFTRTVQLPEGVDHDGIKAHFKNGVLTVHLPKKPEAQQTGRKIAVKGAA
ncbi:MAG: Hsp20/alpha crystallin family protein [Roseicyclus sp.]|nr:Hsp20/alpha crystallin family protein [Roseicyclus sp.]MBO6625650.1 Hsp20/alpha crystallin family protein [Roseicyclus sp.]MBO6921706.1 Hsp20/alpha crystallin family protein [Roseicyclus sp.]